MNTKSIILAGVIGLGCAGLADAATQYVYVSGSTAGRNAFYNAITDGTTVFDATPTVVAQGSSDPSKATYHLWHGTIGGADTIVKAHWSGSEGGITDISGSGTQTFLDNAAGTSSSSTGPFVSSTVDLAAADNDKAFSRNPTAAITGTKCLLWPTVPAFVIKFCHEALHAKLRQIAAAHRRSAAQPWNLGWHWK